MFPKCASFVQLQQFSDTVHEQHFFPKRMKSKRNRIDRALSESSDSDVEGSDGDGTGTNHAQSKKRAVGSSRRDAVVLSDSGDSADEAIAAVTNLIGSAVRPGHVAGLGHGHGGGGAADVADDADGAAVCDVGIRRPKMLELNFYTNPEDKNSAHPAFWYGNMFLHFATP